MPLPNPPFLPEPFAALGDKNTIPDVPVSPGAASFDLGFPPLTQQPLSSGGVPPDRLDFNGVLYDITQHTVFLQQGGVYKWDSTTGATGYQKGSVVMLDNELLSVMSMVDANVANPNVSMTGWTIYSSTGLKKLLRCNVQASTPGANATRQALGWGVNGSADTHFTPQASGTILVVLSSDYQNGGATQIVDTQIAVGPAAAAPANGTLQSALPAGWVIVAPTSFWQATLDASEDIPVTMAFVINGLTPGIAYALDAFLHTPTVAAGLDVMSGFLIEL